MFGGITVSQLNSWTHMNPEHNTSEASPAPLERASVPVNYSSFFCFTGPVSSLLADKTK